MVVLARRIENAARRSVTFRQMDRAAYLIARTLDQGGPASVNELARVLGLDGSTVTRQVAAMEARQQAARKAHPDDGRAWLISLTPAGRDEMNAISAIRRQRFAEYTADWAPDDLDQFSRMLQRFNASLATAVSSTAGSTDTEPGGHADGSSPPSSARRRVDHRQSVLPPRRTR
ncbi:MAG: MarR family transcriptional regulator [Acidimicrobiales bacterium]|nr:MarR family transcriptional regulator [Acidimicrobiales bacterium]